ncbi:MAG: hypothetical protein WC959_06065 [Kiritimatiellales bacterium]
MDVTGMLALAKIGGPLALGFSALGSAIGISIAGSAGIGAWKKCYAQNRPAPFLLLSFIGAPLSQTIYGLIVMLLFKARAIENPELWLVFLIGGLMSGIALGASAWLQGRVCAAGCDAYAETGKGFVNYIIAVGTVETIALFVMIFMLLAF